MDALRDTLRELTDSLREKILTDGSPAWLELARWLQAVNTGLDALDESLRGSLLDAFQTARPLNHATLPILLEQFEAHGRAIRRAAVQRDRWRYPTTSDLQLINERVCLAPPECDADRLNRARLLAMLTPPDADALQRATTLFEALNTLQPFREYNASTASIAALAFLGANGFRATLSPDEAAERLLSGEWASLSLQPDESATRFTYADLIEQMIADYRDSLVRAERVIQERQQLAQRDALPTTMPVSPQPVPGPASRWRYLTVQDLIWINTEITGAPQRYNYDRLEEATYYQYSYRQSMDVPLQAARFLWGYLTYYPFARGNLGTALIGVLTFLQINGYDTHLPPDQACDWLLSVARRRKHPLDAIRQIIASSAAGANPQPVREVAHYLIEQYESALHQLEEVNPRETQYR